MERHYFYIDDSKVVHWTLCSACTTDSVCFTSVQLIPGEPHVLCNLCADEERAFVQQDHGVAHQEPVPLIDLYANEPMYEGPTAPVPTPLKRPMPSPPPAPRKALKHNRPRPRKSLNFDTRESTAPWGNSLKMQCFMENNKYVATVTVDETTQVKIQCDTWPELKRAIDKWMN